MKQLSARVQAPDFELNDVNGVVHRLGTALSHGRVVLAFFKVSCPTCQLTFPHIQRIFANAGKDSPMQLWAISQDDADDTRRFARQYGITFDMLIDEYPYDVSNDYGIVSVPTLFIVEQDGNISMSDTDSAKPA